jgi:site-specific DNA recombinase
MKVAIYLRVSTAEQAEEGFSIAAQKERLKAYIQSQGWELYRIYEDGGYSGGTMNRPSFMKLIDDMRRKEFDLILVYKLDRLSRNMRDLSNLVHEMDRCGVYFKSATEPFDTTTPAGKLIFNMLGSVAEFERGMIAERVKMGMLQKAKEGKGILGFNVPYGYLFQEHTLIPREEEATVVKEIFRLYLSGMNTGEVSRMLNEKNIPTKRGKMWKRQTVLNILTNPVYAGYHRWEYFYWRGSHLPLVSVEQWNQVQRFINARTRKAHGFELKPLEIGEYGVIAASLRRSEDHPGTISN